ncbi:MAG: YqfO family protein [Methylococcales bacterium]|nr:YqfO family protein [Methylococcales bacterium]
MYKLNFYVPESHVEQVKDALFNKGAGRIGQYDHCSWQVLGEGQFRPLKGSNPFLGKQGQLEKVMEYKVEMVCEDGMISDVVKELITAHPYEEPAYEVYILQNF